MRRFSLVFLALLLGVAGCRSEQKPVYWEDFTDVFSAAGRVTDYQIRQGRPVVIQILDLPCWEDALRHTPDGKIDRIIAENPIWEFFFYCECPVEDSLKVMKMLERYHCGFPLILDPEKKCQRLRYGEKSHYTAVGAICDERGKTLGGSIIGTTQSFFDSNFLNAKREIAWRLQKHQRRKK